MIRITTTITPLERGWARLESVSGKAYGQTVAKAEGCCFHFASDTHTLEGVGGVKKLVSYVRALGLSRGDIAAWVRRAPRPYV